LDSNKEVLKPGGKVLVRDHCVGDLIEQRFEGAKGAKRLGVTIWLHVDGTQCLYISQMRLSRGLRTWIRRHSAVSCHAFRMRAPCTLQRQAAVSLASRLHYPHMT
jgi:hypothetical protein